MLEAALVWHRRFRTDLEEEKFKFHDYNLCIAFKIVEGSQHLVQFHVNDILSSHMKSKANDEFTVWDKEKYGTMKPVEVKRGKVFEFLGIVLDFSQEGECHVWQEDHVEDIIVSWLEEVKETEKELTPCNFSLFEKGEGELSRSKKQEIFHTTTAKCLFIGNQVDQMCYQLLV